MLKQYNHIIWGMILLIFILPLVNAGQPIDFETGLEITPAQQITYQQNENITIDFFVYNKTNGVPTTNTTISCIYYLANNHGVVGYLGEVSYLPHGYWDILIARGNFSRVGEYNYGIKCNSSTQGGAYIGMYEITPTGETLSASQGKLSSSILISIMLLMFFFALVGLKLMDYEKTFPIAIFFIVLSMIVAIFGLYLGVIYSQDYLGSATSQPQAKLFIGVLYGFTALVFIGLLWFIISVVKALELKKSEKEQGDNWNSKTNSYEY